MLIPESEETKEQAYEERFNSWIKLHPDQVRLFCEHGFYFGGTKPGSFIHRCKKCKKGINE